MNSYVRHNGVRVCSHFSLDRPLPECQQHSHLPRPWGTAGNETRVWEIQLPRTTNGRSFTERHLRRLQAVHLQHLLNCPEGGTRWVTQFDTLSVRFGVKSFL